MLNESLQSQSKIFILKEELLNKKQELEKIIKKKKSVKSGISKLYSLLILILVFALILQLFWLFKPDFFGVKEVFKGNNNDFSELALLYFDKREKDSLKLKELNDKIAFYQEREEIKAFLREVEISDSLLFDNDELVVTVYFPNKDKEKKEVPFNKNYNKRKVVSNVNYVVAKESKPIVEKSNSSISNADNKYYFSTDKFAVFSGCSKKKTEVKKRKCLNTKIKRFISKKIDKNLFKSMGIKRVDVLVGVDKKGLAKTLSIKGIRNEAQQKEIFRVISFLPKFLPAIDNGSKVGVKFNVPILF
jgi:hypothetical protein